jgi:hypothetical protein
MRHFTLHVGGSVREFQFRLFSSNFELSENGHGAYTRACVHEKHAAACVHCGCNQHELLSIWSSTRVSLVSQKCVVLLMAGHLTPIHMTKSVSWAHSYTGVARFRNCWWVWGGPCSRPRYKSVHRALGAPRHTRQRVAPLCCIGTRHAAPSQAPHASPLCHDVRARDGCVLRSGVDIIRTDAGCQGTATTTTTQLSLVRSITAHEAQSSSARCCHTHQRQGWPASH